MGNNNTLALTSDHLQRVATGLGLLRIACILVLISQVAGPLLGSYYYGGGFFWLGCIASILGIVATSKIRTVILELHSGAPGIDVQPQRVAQAPAAIAQPTPQEERQPEFAPDIHSEPKPNRPSILQNIDWEEWIGKKLLQKAGILIVLIGMIVFLKYSFDNGWIGELGRIALATLAASVLMGLGEWFHGKYPHWSQAFTGGGLALLYFTVWAAHVFYHNELISKHGLQVSPAMAMALYSFITAIGALAAIRYKAQTIAWFTVLGGYLTPLLIETPAPNAIGLTVYVAILAAGILTLSFHQRWSYLAPAAFILTQMYLFGVIFNDSAISDPQQIVIAIGFFILFALVPLLYQFRVGRTAEPDDIGLILLDGLTVFVAVVDATGGFGSDDVGFISLALATVYMAFAAAALVRRSQDGVLVNTYALSSIGLIALALYAQMEWEWVAAGWAPFSLLLMFVATRMERRSVFLAAMGLLIGSLFFLTINLPVFTVRSEDLWHPFTSHWALLSYIVFGSLIGWIALGRIVPKSLLPDDSFSVRIAPGLHLVVALIAFLGLTFEVTALEFAITLPLSLAYLGFCVAAIVAFAVTGVTVWFVAALVVQVLVILFTFFLGNTSGMISPLLHGPAVLPFTHPWAGVSLLSIIVMLGMLFAVIRRATPVVSGANLRGLLIGVALVQVWVHISVEIQHLQAVLFWSDAMFHRVLSGWWILFTAPLFAWALAYKNSTVLKSAIVALCIPFAKDLLLLVGDDASMYEVILWTVIPVGLLAAGSHLRRKNLLTAATAMLVAITAVDMLSTIGDEAGLLHTVWWAIAGLVTMSLGFAKREQMLRRLAIGIFAAMVVKLLVFDFQVLSAGIRIAASILTGLLLIGASYLYQRFDELLTKRT